MTPGGPECEGCIPTFTADAGTVFVLVVGSRAPVAGDYLIAKPIGGRWVAEGKAGPPTNCNASPFCVRSFPTTAFIGDSVGTHTLSQIAVSNTAATWRSAPFSYTDDMYTPNVSPSNDCTLTSTTGTAIYTFSLTCQSDGTFRGTLRLSKVVICCVNDATGIGLTRFSSGTPSVFTGDNVDGIFACGDTVFDFSYPTTFTTGCCTNTLVMPGGGGLLSVTF